jgi:hypothetical protein
MKPLSLMLAIVLAFAAIAAPSSAFASAHPGVLDVADVIARAKDLNGSEVTIEGEAVGESLNADIGYEWVNVLDDDTAVGVVMSVQDTALVRTYGEWNMRGDRIRVTGLFSAACPEHGGDLDIHAVRVAVVSPGAPIDRPVNGWKAIVAAAGASTAVLLYALYGRGRRRSPF